jgi:hypothetical protein
VTGNLELADLTVVTPTFNRTSLALRSAKYFADIGVRQVLVDGSPEPLDARLMPQVLNGDLLTYLWVPIRPSELHHNHFARRLSTGIQSVTTPFCVLCPDDSFMMSGGLETAVRALRHREEIDVVTSRYVGNLKRHENTGHTIQIMPKYLTKRGHYFLDKPGLKRLLMLPIAERSLLIYHWWSVFRVDSLKRLWTPILTASFDEYRLAEWSLNISAFAHFTMRQHDQLMWLRSTGIEAPDRQYRPATRTLGQALGTRQSADMMTTKQIFVSACGGIIGGSGKAVLVWQYLRFLTYVRHEENLLLRMLKRYIVGLFLLLDSVVRGVVYSVTKLLACGKKTSNADQSRGGLHPDLLKCGQELAAAGLFLKDEFRSKMTARDVADLRRVAALLVGCPNESNRRA